MHYSQSKSMWGSSFNAMFLDWKLHIENEKDQLLLINSWVKLGVEVSRLINAAPGKCSGIL